MAVRDASDIICVLGASLTYLLAYVILTTLYSSPPLQFIKMVQIHKFNNDGTDQEGMVEAFVALGGQVDKSGTVATAKLKEVCDDFELTIDIAELVAMYDADQSGFIDFEEFALMLRDDPVQRRV